MNHTPIRAITVTQGAGATTISDKHRAVIVSNTGTGTSEITLKFLNINGADTGNFVIRLVANSGPFYIPCRVTSISVAASATAGATILLLA
jgi:hypothetical protein